MPAHKKQHEFKVSRLGDLSAAIDKMRELDPNAGFRTVRKYGPWAVGTDVDEAAMHFYLSHDIPKL